MTAPDDITFHASSPILRVADLGASLDYYVQALGFTVNWRHQDVVASVSRGPADLMLCQGDQGLPGSWVYIGVGDAERLHEELRGRGARIRQGPTSFAWALEIQVHDLDGNVLRFGSDPDPRRPFGPWLDMHGVAWTARDGGGWTREVPAAVDAGRLTPVTLRGATVRLEPLDEGHLPGLCAVGLEPALWQWIPTPVTDAAGMRRYVRTALAEREAGRSLPFATMLQADGRVIGSTRYGNIELAQRRLEIGWTWLGTPWQRSAANTEAKLLLLAHAFETLGLARVEFKTDVLNAASRAALVRLGAVAEGVFRRHMQTASGRVRDTIYFSIIDAEWPAVKARLTARLARGPGGTDAQA